MRHEDYFAFFTCREKLYFIHICIQVPFDLWHISGNYLCGKYPIRVNHFFLFNLNSNPVNIYTYTVYPKKYAHGFVLLCFVVVMQSFIMNSHEVFIHIHPGCFAGTGAIVRLPQCQWSKPDGYGKISQCITTTKHSKAKTVCIFLGIYCTPPCPCLKFKLGHGWVITSHVDAITYPRTFLSLTQC